MVQTGPNIHVKVLVLWGHTQYTSIDRILAIFDPLLVEKHRHLANPPPIGVIIIATRRKIPRSGPLAIKDFDQNYQRIIF